MIKEKMTKSEWLKANGFSEHGVTYVVMGNSYKIKDELKDMGFKFSPLLKWHCEDNNYQLPPECSYYALRYEDVFVWNEENGVTYMQEGARLLLENLFNPPRDSKSEYQGAIGEKIALPSVKVVNVGGYAGAYGYTWVYTFKDGNDNEYSWFTTVNKALAVGMECMLSGTVKEYKEYKGVKTTVLTRCKIGE